MKVILGRALAGAVWVVAGCASGAEVQFNRDIRPILSDKCFACHGPDAGNRKSKLRLDVEAEAKADLGGGRRGIVAGDPDKSGVMQRVVSTNKTLRMPPAYLGHAALTAEQIDILQRWIAEGGRYQSHWSFVPPVKAELPAVRDAGWALNAVDRFVLARLEKEGLTPSGRADKARLLRRVTLDLTGLAPTPEETRAFVADEAEGAYERVVERLLASPRYAERMAIRWLEAARYADTNGYQSDGPRDMWRWRDWVIEAFHKNKPFDEFTVEQIAGDLLPGARLDQKIATGFQRNHRTSAEGGIVDEEFRVEYVADRTETTATVWLGATLGCARCHDHKYDPFPQKDFYRLFAFYNNVPEKGFVYNFGNEEPFIKAPLPEQARRLAELEEAVRVAQGRLDGLAEVARKAERSWEKRARELREDWVPSEALGLRADGGGEFDGKRELEIAPSTEVRLNFRDPFTFAAWIEPREGKGAIVSKAEDYWEGTGHGLYLVDGKLRLHVVFRWTDLGFRVETEEAIPLGARQHVAVTYDGSMKARNARIYVNGRPMKMKILFDQGIWPLDPKEPWRVGAGGGLRFTGKIDGVRVWRREMAASEVAAVALAEPVSAIARKKERTAAEREKLRLAFLEWGAPEELREARALLGQARIARDEYYETIPTVMVMEERAERRPTYLLKRGAYDAPGEAVEPAVPAALGAWNPEWPRNRLGLAKWLVARDNPLTARVTVNRFWQMLFGVGLVKTVEDFGSQGEAPSHPELLDWLAAEFLESGWDVKRIIKTMVMSATYQQESKAAAGMEERDPENRLLARGARERLAPEMVRDQALQVSGLLVEKVGGPSVKPYQPEGLWKELASGEDYKADKGEGLYRRTLYQYWRRTIAPPSMMNFDSPSRETCVVRESRTNTPLQALNLMNDVTYVEAARKLGERMWKAGATDEARLQAGWRVALGREPNARELAAAGKALRQFRQHYGAHAEEARQYVSVGESARDEGVPLADAAAYAAVGSLILNLDEMVTKE
ncbi:MAG: DUF1553 domain-containing protein [Acidobacteria bacterium]|nr:DUF1553 domain-containing protein [Acidobacteriota bacterium]